VTLGILLPELCDLLVGRTSVVAEQKVNSRPAFAGRQVAGPLVLLLRCSALGSFMGMIPGLGRR
jgi:hypothetical protein